jgi:hypothetical protein
VLACAEWNGPIELHVVGDAGVEVIVARRIGLDADDARHSEVGLPSAAAAQLARGPAWLLVDDEVADRLPHLVQVGAREVIPFLRQVVVGRYDLCCEDGAGHGALQKDLEPVKAAEDVAGNETAVA